MSVKDETKETNQDSSQVTEDTSEGKKGSTSEETKPETYTKEQVTNMISDALSHAGRDAKSLELREQALTEGQEALNKSMTELAKAQDEFEGIKNNPDAVDWLQKKKALQEAQKAFENEKRDFAKTKVEYDAQIKSAQEETREKAIWGIAASFTNEPSEMANLFVKLNNLKIDDMEQLKTLAETIASTKPRETKETPEPDPGTTQGGAGEKSEEQKLKERYPTMK